MRKPVVGLPAPPSLRCEIWPPVLAATQHSCWLLGWVYQPATKRACRTLHLVLHAFLPALFFASALPAQTLRAPTSYKDLKFPPLRQIEIPTVERVTLPSG